ncbi:mandelate racemase/muconate lactonizing enzyme family protein [Pigmentiphaga soli]|uniref:Mandelate racemase/muconate lactonizing enzyme family protein n=1 Tax=Pigmentiphaga soli TaxID=1007095 RepID=A0ABP8HCR4_9BURK
MIIEHIEAKALRVPVTLDFAGIRKSSSMGLCLASVRTDDGLVGHGISAISNEAVVAAAVNHVAAPALAGLDPLRREMIWDRLYWLLSPRGQTGHASHAIAAVDNALWDIAGKRFGAPIWRLLGAAREKVQAYVTFGYPFFDIDELAQAARYWHARGEHRLKMVVGFQGLQNRDAGRPPAAIVAEDARRVHAVRQAVGDEASLYIDANCSLDAVHAADLCRLIEADRIAFFEEPVTQNDVRQMADLRRRTGVALAAGQNEGLIHRFRDLLLAGAVDYLQPNVVIGGGITQCVRIAGLAQAFNVPIVNGGAWPFHNMHLHAGLAHGTMVEYHHLSVEVCKKVFVGLPELEGGYLRLPEAPGFGFEPDPAALAEFAR